MSSDTSRWPGGAGTIYQRSPPVLWRSTLNGVLLLVPDADDMVKLPPPGDLIWALLEASLSEDDLVQLLQADFPDDRGSIRGGVAEFLESLVGLGAVVMQ